MAAITTYFQTDNAYRTMASTAGQFVVAGVMKGYSGDSCGEDCPKKLYTIMLASLGPPPREEPVGLVRPGQGIIDPIKRENLPRDKCDRRCLRPDDHVVGDGQEHEIETHVSGGIDGWRGRIRGDVRINL